MGFTLRGDTSSKCAMDRVLVEATKVIFDVLAKTLIMLGVTTGA